MSGPAFAASATTPASAAFGWSGDPGDAAFFLAEALSEWEADGIASLLLVDFQKKRKPGLPLSLRPGRALPSGDIKLLGENGTPCCRAESLPRALKDAERVGKADTLASRIAILLPERGKLHALADCFTEVLFLLSSTKDGLDALGETAAALGGAEGRKTRISVVVSGTERIEDAAEFFLEAQEAVSKRGRATAETRFVGHFSLPEEKARLHASEASSYRGSFAGDGVYGQLKAVGLRWLGDPATAASLQTGPGGATYAGFAKRLGELGGKLA